MKYLQIKSQKINNLVVRGEFNHKFYRSLFLNVNLPASLRQVAFNKLQLEKKQSSLSFFRGRCLFTHRSRAVLNKFKQSRMQFRYFASFGLLPGIRKASW